MNALPLEQSSIRNLLLSRLSATDFSLLAPHLEEIDLAMREPIIMVGMPITHVVFPDTAVASIVAATPDGRQAEVGLTGREGMIEVATINGIDRSPLETFAQIPGRAWRLPLAELRRAISASDALRATLLLYAQSVIIQMATTALVNVSYPLEQRLARWLLMTHDRIDGDDIPMTHQFLSLMLGVRRAGVTTTVHKLESRGVIRARRALILITDRVGLLEIARDTYGPPEIEYARLLGVDIRRPTRRSGNGGYSSSASRA